LGGICGSDLGNISFKSSPAMEPFGSFPAVLGHEILGRVTEVGPEMDPGLVGQRVVVDPMIHCDVRGHAPEAWCPSCRAGLHGTCEMAGEEGSVEVGGKVLSPGATIGYHADLPGGWGQSLIAHERQLFPVPEALDDRIAVLVEPMSIGVHAVLRSRALSSPGPILVIGSGAIAFSAIWALRTLGYEGHLVAQAKRPHEVALAKALGADETVTPGDEARSALVATGARAYMPMVGGEVYAGGGYDMVFDCVGSPSSLTQSLRSTAARGSIVLLGCAGQMPKLDLTFLWARELDLQGYVVYGREDWKGGAPHTFEITMDRMVADGDRLSGLVTHVFPLDQYKDGLRAAYNHRESKAVKVVLEP
ncbi:MAG: zinc-binding dehydrogenase, partial [Gemmatimonadetes bacterium]|nr:zinc-binding dehydrogenase [Gemmatimonadota bacterium]